MGSTVVENPTGTAPDGGSIPPASTLRNDMSDIEDKTVAVDLDGTIIEFDWETYQSIRDFGKVDRDMTKALKKARAQGWYVIIHSCRMTPMVYEPDGLTAKTALIHLRCFLVDNDIPFDDIWVGPGKPVAKFYVDDRGLRPEEFKDTFKGSE